MRVLGFLAFILVVMLAGCSSARSQLEDSASTREVARERSTYLELPRNLRTSSEPFLVHMGPGEFENTLALNVDYAPIRALRIPIEQRIGRPLKFLTAWDPNGEAHVTTVTPVEFHQKLRPYFSTMHEINRIALRNHIQSADLKILGIGSGKLKVDGVEEETFYVLVESQKLRQIRLEIWEEYVRRGGPPKAWDPSRFFPHITIGYTRDDIHEPNLLRNVETLDERFPLRFR